MSCQSNQRLLVSSAASKAFTRESDDAPDLPLQPRRSSPLPPGTKNYLTAGGAQLLREELDRLLSNERPQLATSSGDEEASRRLQLADERIEHLQQSLHLAIVVNVRRSSRSGPHWATVTVRNSRLAKFVIAPCKGY